MSSVNANELKSPLYALNSRISSVLSIIDGNYDNISYEQDDEEEAFLAIEFRSIIDKLSKVEDNLKYLQKPITEVCILHKNELGRYETKSGTYFTCGSVIEAFIYDDWHETFRWVKSRIEHKNGDYYLYGFDEIKLEGLKVRVRG